MYTSFFAGKTGGDEPTGFAEQIRSADAAAVILPVPL